MLWLQLTALAAGLKHPPCGAWSASFFLGVGTKKTD